MRKLLTVLAIAALCLAAVPAVSAAPREPGPKGEVKPQNGGNCSNQVSTVFGHTSSQSSVSRSGVAADYIKRDTLSTGFKECAPTFFDNNLNGVFAMLGIYPRSAINGCSAGPFDCYLRFGIAECVNESGSNYCNGAAGSERIFAVAKGCGYTFSWNLGAPADNFTNLYFYDQGSAWAFFADGVHELDVSESSSAVACWLDEGINGASYLFEMWDGQDSIGTENTSNTQIFGAQYGTYGGGWHDVTFGNGNCLYGGGEGVCQLAGAKIWTWTYD